MKPSDFFVGIIDFFAALLPGAVVTWLCLQYVDPADLRRWIFTDGTTELMRGLALFLSSYILGHFVFLVGARLDPVYDEWRKRAHPTDENPNYRAVDALRKVISPEIGDSEAAGAFSTLKWSRAYIAIHAPGARAEIDAIEANSKFFRSLVVVFALMTAHFLLGEQRLGLTAASVVLGVLSFLRFRDQRWKFTELSYATAVILHGTKLATRERP